VKGNPILILVEMISKKKEKKITSNKRGDPWTLKSSGLEKKRGAALVMRGAGGVSRLSEKIFSTKANGSKKGDASTGFRD